MRYVISLAIAITFALPVSALAQGPFDVKTLPDQIKSLKWRDTDFEGASLVERCRALDLLNDALDSIRNQFSADADLLSQYIDDNNLGPEFASTPPGPAREARTFADAQKIALALLRGPMSTSTYSAVLSGAPDDQLAAFLNMNQSGCQWKWAEMADRRDRVIAMTGFLKAKGKLEAYTAWVPGELDRREAEQKASTAEKQQAAAAKAKEQSERAQELIRQRQQEDEAQDQADREKQAAMLQQAMAAAQSRPATTGGVVVPSDDDDPYYYYGGLAAYRGAALYRNAAYRGAANAATDRRMKSWHRGGGRRR